MKNKLLVLGLIVLAFFIISSNLGKDELKNNYYLEINKDIIANNELETGEYSWSKFLEAQDIVDSNTDVVVNDILTGNNFNLEEQEVKVIKNIYSKSLDIVKRDADGIKVLEPYINEIWDVSTVEELIDKIIVIENELGIDILSNVQVLEDYQDNSQNIIYFYPVTFAFGASGDYIVDADYMTYKAYLRRACIQLWKVYGLDTQEAREVVARVFGFYEEVAKNSKLSDELNDIISYYQVVTEDEISTLFGNVSEKYLSRRNLDNRSIYSLVDKEQYQYLIDSLKLENLGVWKEVIITKILASYASYGSSEYVEVVDNLNAALLGEAEEKINEDRAIEIVKNLFSSEIDSVYDKEFLNVNQEKEIEKMFLEIKDVYKKRIKANEWLSDDAKEKALLKLDEMEIIIGVDDTKRCYEVANELEVSSDSLISDVIKIQQIVVQEDLKRLDSGEKINLVQQTQVNAYYQPLDNSIIIPVAFFELIDEDADYYEELGTLGMILAHEVTHAFDSNGSRFDEDGNLNDWWSETDKESFEKLKQEVIDYYSQYEVLSGKYINGEKTVNENIADLGAIKCIVEIAKDRQASDDDFKVMFTSFANIWASVDTEQYMELLLLQDVHSPNQFRVNAVLSSTEEFYQVYNIYPWNEMWVNEDKRVMVW